MTGIKPTGIPHIGNYFGAIKPAIEMSKNDEYDNYYFIADYHALNFIKDPKLLKENTKILASTWLACGLDIDRIVFYKQSLVPEVTELNWLLCNVTSKGLMNRAHAYKAIVEKNILVGDDPDNNVNMGLYNYPILMAADILLINSKYVPVGLDQKQHVEMARDIAKAFNKTYGNTFVIPQEKITEEVATITGLDGRKMSKSYNNTIPLFCEENKLKKLISSIVTDSSLPTEPKTTNCAVFDLYKLFATKEEVEVMRELYSKGISWADAKKALFEVANRTIAPIRDKFNYYMEHYDQVEKKIEEGSNRVRQIARETIVRARKNIGLD